MADIRKRHTADFKSKVAIDTIRQQQITNELTTKYGVHATQINNWKKQALTAIPEAFKGKHEREQQDHQAEIHELHRPIYFCDSLIGQIIRFMTASLRIK